MIVKDNIIYINKEEIQIFKEKNSILTNRVSNNKGLFKDLK